MFILQSKNWFFDFFFKPEARDSLLVLNLKKKKYHKLQEQIRPKKLSNTLHPPLPQLPLHHLFINDLDQISQIFFDRYLRTQHYDGWILRRLLLRWRTFTKRKKKKDLIVDPNSKWWYHIYEWQHTIYYTSRRLYVSVSVCQCVACVVGGMWDRSLDSSRGVEFGWGCRWVSLDANLEQRSFSMFEMPFVLTRFQRSHISQWLLWVSDLHIWLSDFHHFQMGTKWLSHYSFLSEFSDFRLFLGEFSDFRHF